MEDLAIKRLQDIYGLNHNIPHSAFQFPRLPPGLAHPMFRIYENPMKEQFSQVVSINQKLQGFQHLYHQHAAGLLSMSSDIVPTGHPLYNRRASVETVKLENDKLLKENLELKKKLEKQNSDKK